MATDIINVVNVSSISGVNEITYNIVTDAPTLGRCLDYEGVARVEVWLSSTNNRGAAAKVGDAYTGSLGVQFKAQVVGASVNRYAWFRAVNVAGNVGDWFPASPTGGILATTSAQVPPAGSVGPVQTGTNFTTLSALSSNFGTITAGSITGVTFTGGVFQTAAAGRRIQITGADNFIRVYNAANQMVACLGEFVLVPSFDFTILAVARNSANAGVVFQNETGEALYCLGQVGVAGRGNKAAIAITHGGSGSNAHGVLFDVPSGGAGSIGVSSSAGGAAFFANRGGFFDASGVGYLSFTGAHYALMSKAEEAEIGDIVVDLDVIERHGVSDAVTTVARSAATAQRGALGVLSTRQPFGRGALPHMSGISRHRRYRYAKKFDLATINGVGEGQINVCGLGGDLEKGDFICTSAMPGKGQRQNDANGDADDLMRRCTVARVRERVAFSSPSEVRTVAAIYLCG